MTKENSDIYFIGGSPCSGKSTVTERIVREYGLYYFKVDDYLEDYMKKATLKGKEVCSKYSNMTPEQIWMREPEIQCVDELQIYRELFEFIKEELSRIQSFNGIITEGAAYLPELMMEFGVDNSHYLNITPTEDFQYTRFKERPFIPYVLEGCSDKEKAFDNWMKRDALFAEYVRNQSRELDYKTIVIDGSVSSEEIFKTVCQHFDLVK